MLLIISLILINYIDRSAIAYAVGPISKSLKLNSGQWGLISSAFSIGYLVIAFLSGPMVDRLGPKKILGGSITIWSLASIFTSFASTFFMIFIARVLLGIGEGPGFPSASRAVSRWMPKKEQGLVLSLIGGAGVAASLLIGGPIITQLISHLGWRATFIVLGGLGLIWASAWLFAFKDDPSIHRWVNRAELNHINAEKSLDEKTIRKHKLEPRQIFSNKSLWAIAFGFFSWGYLFWGLLYWTPEYLSKVYNLNLQSVGLFSTVPWAAGVAGALFGGFLLNKLYKISTSLYPRTVVMAIFVFLAGLCMIPVFLFHSLTIAIVFISLGIGFGFVTGGFWWVASIETSPEQPGFAAGVIDASFAASGILAPIIMGYVVQFTGSFSDGFIVTMAFATAGALVMVLFTRNEKRVVNKVAINQATIQN